MDQAALEQIKVNTTSPSDQWMDEGFYFLPVVDRGWYNN